MKASWLALHVLVAVLASALSWPASAQDRNVLLPVAELEQMLQSEPLRIVSAAVTRPKAQGDITLRTETHPLEAVNDVLDALRSGDITGRAVLVP